MLIYLTFILNALRYISHLWDDIDRYKTLNLNADPISDQLFHDRLKYPPYRQANIIYITNYKYRRRHTCPP